jgi:hypothetical protein
MLNDAFYYALNRLTIIEKELLKGFKQALKPSKSLAITAQLPTFDS